MSSWAPKHNMQMPQEGSTDPAYNMYNPNDQQHHFQPNHQPYNQPTPQNWFNQQPMQPMINHNLPPPQSQPNNWQSQPNYGMSNPSQYQHQNDYRTQFQAGAHQYNNYNNPQVTHRQSQPMMDNSNFQQKDSFENSNDSDPWDWGWEDNSNKKQNPESKTNIQDQIRNQANAIVNSFSTTNDDNWNWTFGDQQKSNKNVETPTNQSGNVVPVPPVVSSSNLMQQNQESRKLSSSSNASRNSDFNKPPVNMLQKNMGDVKNQDVNVLSSGVKNMSLQNEESGNKEIVSSQNAPPKSAVAPPPMGGSKPPPPGGNIPPPSSISNVSYRRSGQLSHRSANRTSQPQNIMPIAPMNAPPSIPDLSGQQNLMQNVEAANLNDAAQNHFVPGNQPYNPITSTSDMDSMQQSNQNLINQSNIGMSQPNMTSVQNQAIMSTSNQNMVAQIPINTQMDQNTILMQGVSHEHGLSTNIANQNIPLNLLQQPLYLNQETQNINQTNPNIFNQPNAPAQSQGFCENQEYKQPTIPVQHPVELTTEQSIRQPNLQPNTGVPQPTQPVNLSSRQPARQTNLQSEFTGNQIQEHQQSNQSMQPNLQELHNQKLPPTTQNQPLDFVHMNQENPNSEINMPDNSERPDLTFRPIAPVENNENLVSNQERNEYLQTSHLSDSHQEYQELTDVSYIPPGLSRMVPGRPENGSPTADLDRMIPGQQYDRQIDGQNSSQSGQYYGERHIPGSNDNSPDQFNPPPNDERVVTGLEDEHLDTLVSNNEHRNIDMVGSDSPSSNVSDRNVSEEVRRSDVLDGADDVDESGMMTQGREVDMDGENLQDAQRAAEPDKEATGGTTMSSSVTNIGTNSANSRREESADGVNLQDDNKVVPPQSGPSNDAVDKNLVQDGNNGRKQHSRHHHDDTTDDSERERRYRSDRRERDRDGGRKERGGGRGDAVTSDKRRYERDRDDRKEYRNRDRDRDRDRDGDYRDRKSHSYRDSDRHRRHRDHHAGRGRYETEDTEDYYSDRDRRNKYRERDKDSDHEQGRYQGRERDGKSGSSRRYDRDRRESRDPKDDRRRGDRYDRRSEYDQDSYRNSSRTGSDRERRAHQAGYGGFEPFNYYTAQHQQFSSEFYKYYENLRRTNPQAYAEWYHKFYSQGGAGMGMPVTPSSSVFAMQTGVPLDANYSRDSIPDDRASVHSGRSSANDKDRYMNVTLRQQYYAGSQTGYYGSQHHHSLMTQSYQRHSRAHSEFSDSNFRELQMDETSSLNMTQTDMGVVDKSPERLTPAKFPLVHVKCALTAVSLLTVMPPENVTGPYDVELHDLSQLTKDDEICNQLTSYPGPLINGVTHKKTVIEFCEDRVHKMTVEMIQGDSCGVSVTYLESYILMWELMILLLRQNGRVVGTDIAELLMKHSQTNSKSLRNDLSRTESVISLATSHSQAVADELEHDEQPNDNIENTKPQKRLVRKTSKNESAKISEKELTDKFREFLIYGNCKDALEWAMSHHLWGHALFLASKLDKRVYANVMTRFANGLPLNDPLQTLYQLMSGRQPAAVTCALDEKWGNWKPHLAMILSNNSERHSELNRKAITTLADTLMSKGDLYAAHFCYLMAQVPFGKYCNRNNEKLVLLGSCHATKRFEEFSNNEAIMLTEVYEYASSLNNSSFIITEFQPFKLLLALRMLDYGAHQKTLLYMERITEAILTDPTQYPIGFMRQVYEWGDKLKFYDPAGRMDDIGEDGTSEVADGDQQWLRKLKAVIDRNDSNIVEQDSPMMHTEYHNQNQLYTNQYLQPVTTIDNNQQPGWQQQQPNYSEQPNYAEQPNSLQPNSLQPDYNQMSYVDQSNMGQNQNNQYYDNNYQIGQDYQNNPTENAEIQNYHQGQQYLTQTNEGYNQDSANASADHFQHGYSAQPDVDQHGMTSQEGDQDYWAQQQQQYQQQSSPQISMPGTSSVKRNFMDSDLTDNSTKESKSEKSTQNKSNAKPSASNKTSSSNSGWFGGIWNKLSMKPKNQMILPDDKNPTIVWDPEKRKWTNLEGEEDGAGEVKPPPKLSDLMPSPNVSQSMSPGPQNHMQGPLGAFSTPLGASQMPGNEIPSAPLVNNDGLLKTTQDVVENKTPNLQSNMYKLQRNRTLKKSYVDVFNPGGASSPAPLAPLAAPMAAPTTAPTGGYFIPAPASHDHNNTNEPGVPTFYDPTKSGYH